MMLMPPVLPADIAAVPPRRRFQTLTTPATLPADRQLPAADAPLPIADALIADAPLIAVISASAAEYGKGDFAAVFALSQPAPLLQASDAAADCRCQRRFSHARPPALQCQDSAATASRHFRYRHAFGFH